MILNFPCPMRSFGGKSRELLSPPEKRLSSGFIVGSSWFEGLLGLTGSDWSAWIRARLFGGPEPSWLNGWPGWDIKPEKSTRQSYPHSRILGKKLSSYHMRELSLEKDKTKNLLDDQLWKSSTEAFRTEYYTLDLRYWTFRKI